MDAPVLILQFMTDDAPAYLGSWLQRHGVAADVRYASDGAAFPPQIGGYRALALLGGAMSVNDDLAYLRSAESLIEQAMQRDVPVLGHCLGGQLMARVLGARVGPAPAPEVGWHAMQVEADAAAQHWLGPSGEAHVFHWHYEAFELPRSAVPLARNANCPHQAFALGRHIGLQFHVEVDAAKVALWLAQDDPTYESMQRNHATVHAPQQIRDDTVRHLQAHQRFADRIYANWLPVELISQ